MNTSKNRLARRSLLKNDTSQPALSSRSRPALGWSSLGWSSLVSRRAAPALAVLALGALCAPHAQAATLTFDADSNGANGATDGSATWNPATATDWYNGATTDQAWGNSLAPPNIAVFGSGGTSGIVTVSGTINVGGITFNQGGYTLDATTSGSGTLNFVPTTAGGSVVFTTSGAGQVSTITDNVGFSATGGNANSKFTKTGAGTLVLSQTNNTATANIANPNWTVTGGTFNAGAGVFDSILQVGGSAARLGSNPTTITLDAGTLRLNALFNGSSIAGGSRSVIVTANGGAFVDGTSGAGNNNNSIQGSFTDNAASTTSFFLSNGAGINTNFQNVTSGTGGITWNGGTGTFTKANTYTGATTISTGTLQLGDGTTGNDGSLTTSGITDNAALAYNLFGNQTAGYNISGSGTLTKSGAGTLILTGANTYTGTTTISSGTLQVSNNGTSATLGSGNVVDNAVLAFNRQNAITVGNTISGTGSVSQTGTGTLTLTGANSYKGGTTINTGTLLLGNTGVLGATTGSLTLNSGTVQPIGVANYNGARGATLNLGGFGSTVGALTSTNQSSFGNGLM